MRIIFYISLVFTLLASCKQKEASIQAVNENIIESVYASGIVKSRNQYQVFSPVNGLIQQIFVTEGDSLKKDDAILQVRGETARLNIQNAELASGNAALTANTDKLNELLTNIHFAQTKINNDSLLLERQRNLWAQGIGTHNDLEQRELVFKNDLAGYNAALFRYNDLHKQLNFAAEQSKNNLQISKSIAGDYTLKSQMNGRLYSLLKKSGEMVTTQTPVAVIGGATDFMLELQVDEYDIEKIKPGQKIMLTMDSYKNRVYEASITGIIPYMNDRTRSFTVEAAFTTLPPALYPNLTVDANIIIQTKTGALTIPRAYLLDDSLVLLSDNKKKKVVTGLKDYNKVEIISGLNTTDKLIKPAQ